MGTEPKLRILTFSIFDLDLLTGELRKSGMRQKLAGQPLQVLLLLLERPNEIVTRDQLRHRIWPKNTFVDYDLALKKAINRLRKALGDSADSPRFIETIPRRGYRFIAPVREELVRRATTLEPGSSSASQHGSKSRLRSTLVRAIAVIFGLAVILVLARSAHRVFSPPIRASSHKVKIGR